MKNAIVRAPSSSFVNSINDWYIQNNHKTDGSINLNSALKQHKCYIYCLKKIGLKIHTLSRENSFPDGCFTQDPVIVYKNSALKLNLLVQSRKGEGDAIAKKLEKLGMIINYMNEGNCDGGGILVMEDLKRVLIGLSKRTNLKGFKSVKRFYNDFGFTVEAVPVTKCLHLMTGLSYLGEGNFLISNLLDSKTNKKIQKINNNLILVPDEEVYAVNVIAINRTVIMPKGYPYTKKEIKKLGYKILEIPMSEFEKADGGVTCLSLIF